MISIDLITARRFILGKQGLWPGRRWRGVKGTEQAMRAMEYLQLDPLQIIARSQDIEAAQPRARLHARRCGKTWPTRSASSSTGAAGWPSGRWTNCRTGAC